MSEKWRGDEEEMRVYRSAWGSGMLGEPNALRDLIRRAREEERKRCFGLLKSEAERLAMSSVPGDGIRSGEVVGVLTLLRMLTGEEELDGSGAGRSRDLDVDD